MNHEHIRSDQKQFATQNGARPANGKRPFVAKGHDAILKRMQDGGLFAEIVTISGDGYQGKVVARDKYTITIETKTGTRWTVYKHAIESFSETKVGE